MNGSDFRVELNGFGEEVEEAHVSLMKKVTLDLLDRVTKKSPVDSGRFRANWMVGIGVPNDSESESIVNDAVNRGLATVAPLKFGETVHVSNNLPYAEALEHGSSKQAPAGVLGVSVEEVKAFLKDDQEV